MKKRILSVLLCVALLLSSSVLSYSAYAQNEENIRIQEQFGDDKSYTVMQLADINADNEVLPEVLDMIRLAVDKYYPDLIVLTGDTVVKASNEENYRQIVSELFKAFSKTSVAVCFGDRDDNSGLSRQKQYDIFVENGAIDYDNNFSSNDLNGVGTGCIPIKTGFKDKIGFIDFPARNFYIIINKPYVC